MEELSQSFNGKFLTGNEIELYTINKDTLTSYENHITHQSYPLVNGYEVDIK